MFSWLWKTLEWWNRHQWRIGLVLATFFLIWVAYDVGVLVAMRHNSSLDGPVSARWSTEQLAGWMDKNAGGALRLDSDQTARFRTPDGKIYVLPDFGRTVSKGLLDQIEKNGVDVDGGIQIETTASRRSNTLLYIILDILIKSGVLAFYVAVTFFAVRHFRGAALAGGQKFRHITRSSPSVVHFADVAGHEGPKREITEVVDFLKNPEPFRKVGARPIKGVLLFGPPGNGKTLIAKAVAGEANADFIEQSASSFMELYVGAGAKAVRQLFAEARKHAPCVIFIDEIDAMGSSRSKSPHAEYSQTLNALLTEMDGFNPNEGIVVMAATNRVEDLDEALVRPGRFDRKVHIPLPGRADRLSILQRHARNLPAISASLERWADQTPGFSGAELASLVNEAAYEAASHKEDTITDKAFSLARDKILIGVQDKGRRPSPQELRTIAIHELGHALVRLSFGQKVEKISVEPRGRSLGVTVVEFEEGHDVLLQTRRQIHEELVTMMGGRAAEEVFYGYVTGGAADDMERASSLAREAIRRYGFSWKGEAMPYVPEHSDLLREIEIQAAEWVKGAYQEAVSLVGQNRAGIELALAPLLRDETIDGKSLVALFDLPEPQPLSLPPPRQRE